MADEKRFFDVWIVESNTVYREVPHSVTTDWLQQGRLLGNDKARPSGTGEWRELGTWPEMAAFLPHREEGRADDVAEALEPVELELAWRRRGDDDDQDVDMIPLIDVSLVLLIFFMMTSTVAGISASIAMPEVGTGQHFVANEPAWISIELTQEKTPVYSIGQGTAAVPAEDRNLDFNGLLQQLDAKLASGPALNLLTIQGDKKLESGLIKRLRGELEQRVRKGRIKKIGDAVVERPQS
jgi:biopolymer transport protein ExbD